MIDVKYPTDFDEPTVELSEHPVSCAVCGAQWASVAESMGHAHFTPQDHHEPAFGDLADYVGRHRAPESEFLDTFTEAAAEHTAELEAIAAEPAPLARRAARWFVRNLTGGRVIVTATTAGVLAGTGLGWWLA